MYQTVGQDGLHFIAQALELPLIRRSIQGTAVDQESDYAAATSQVRKAGRVEGDETEDLFQLLKEVLVSACFFERQFVCKSTAFPRLNSTSSIGSISRGARSFCRRHSLQLSASESGACVRPSLQVYRLLPPALSDKPSDHGLSGSCARLGLQALAYLWQFDQSQLLEDMDNAGMESVIIKVAGAGLGVRHLGNNVCSEEMRDELELLVRFIRHLSYGSHPAEPDFRSFSLFYCVHLHSRTVGGVHIQRVKVESTRLSQSTVHSFANA